jgi:hypothetical protein
MHTYTNNDCKNNVISFVKTSPSLKNKLWDCGLIFTNHNPKFLLKSFSFVITHTYLNMIVRSLQLLLSDKHPNNEWRKVIVKFVVTSPALKNKMWDYGLEFANLITKLFPTLFSFV